MYRKTKEELIEMVEELQGQLEIAENDIDYWQSQYSEMADAKEILEEQIEDMQEFAGIKSIDNFKFELEKENLDSKELLDFIENYIAYKND